MARTDPQINIRVEAEFKKKLEHAAIDSGRSLNSEVVHRLEKSFEEIEDYKIYFNLMMEVNKDQQQKIDELHEMVKSLTNKKE